MFPVDMLTDEQNEMVESAAEMLYGLIHVRYILTSKGMNAMVNASDTFSLQVWCLNVVCVCPLGVCWPVTCFNANCSIISLGNLTVREIQKHGFW